MSYTTSWDTISRTACDAERRTIVVSVLQHNVVPSPQSLHINESVFYHDGTDDTECDVSDRAKEPDEVGPETEPGFCLL